MERVIPLYTLDGVKDATKTCFPFSTDDGLGLSLQRFHRADCDDVVILLHGLTSSSDMFIMPEHYNLVSYLLDNGLTDVWCFDYRMSNRFPYNLYPNKYSLDDSVLYDHPKALELVRQQVGRGKRIHVIGHCVGSLTFSMAMAAGTVKDITSYISNSIALTPHIALWSHFKINLVFFLVHRLLGQPYASPSWASDPYLSLGKMVTKVNNLIHRECDDPACHMLSLMWGAGFPALFKHENLDEVTHNRLTDLFGGTGMNYHDHIKKMVKADHRAVKLNNKDPRYESLPEDYFEAGLSIETPILFMTGDENRVFMDSNVHCYEEMKKRGVTHHSLHVVENYGHQDMFMGKHCDRDVFPAMLDFIRSHQQAVVEPAVAGGSL